MRFRNSFCFLIALLWAIPCLAQKTADRPNVIFIYVDDLGYGDLSCYGATKIKTPHLDKLANSGIRFTNAHATSATCTPSRYALMTGQYPWRKSGTGILPGDAALIIPTDKITLPALFQQKGYRTGLVGKWHLGLGNAVQKNWNQKITPGPNEVGFNYSFIFPATADRVPTVFVENNYVVARDSTDPIEVNYQSKIGTEPTGLENPELLKLQSSPNHGHNNTIVNGIGRIGYMSGGKLARWTDEEMPLTFLAKAKEFIESNKAHPFFLFYALTEPHVPRMPSTMFRGKSGLGLRGDAILQLDWTVGEIVSQLQNLGIADNTMIIFSSDNGPVLDDGYQDGAVSQLNGHRPWWELRGGKYSTFEAGTRVPMLISWPGKIKAQVSDAMVSQIDFLATFAQFFNKKLPSNEAPDSEDMWNPLLGKSTEGRKVLVKQGMNSLAIVKGEWKYIEPHAGPAVNKLVNIELGNSSLPQLYNLKTDISEKNNVANQHLEVVKELSELLQRIKDKRN
ncbi:sulfatase family protein [Aquirufa rosea]|uniref:Arylsulfatase n=1 Tax=Aquirufa rosea TaxID=2509241 RepID=A0A4Q1BX00_9BACT|nr:arylsulfatase [Aquirufa rosea]RXK46527.1 arylsulfatase [Aquirufa rosea]